MAEWPLRKEPSSKREGGKGEEEEAIFAQDGVVGIAETRRRKRKRIVRMQKKGNHEKSSSSLCHPNFLVLSFSHKQVFPRTTTTTKKHSKVTHIQLAGKKKSVFCETQRRERVGNYY